MGILTMPLYEYLCEANGEVIEAVHGMSIRFETWGELCEFMSHPLGDTPAETPIKRLVGKGSWTNSPVTIANERTKWLSHGATVSPMRNKKF
jgi:hypothetical protein